MSAVLQRPRAEHGALPARSHLDWLESEAIFILRAAELHERLIVRSVEDSIRRGTVKLRRFDESRNAAQSVTLLGAIAELSFDAAIGGARRDEEKARAKERVFSFRDEFGQWDPKNQ